MQKKLNFLPHFDLALSPHLFQHISRFLVITLLVSLFIAAPHPAQAQAIPWSGVCVGTGKAADVATIQGFECMLANVFLVFFALIGLAAFIMIIVGAITILLSGGNSKGMETGKKTITFAIIGLVLALSGFIIINLLSAFTGVNLLQFEIPRATDTVIDVNI